MPEQKSRRARTPHENFGIFLIVVGVIILAFQFVHIDLGWLPRRWADLSWPLQLIIPGLAVFAVGLVLPDGAGEGLSGFGLIVASVGALLWYQDVTGTWASWAYAWALVFPGAGGLAGIIHGTLHANWRHVRESAGGFLFGIVMFVVLGLVFESWLGFEGFGLGRLASLVPAWIPGAAILAVGLIVLLAGSSGGRRSSARGERQSGQPGPAASAGVPAEPQHMETIDLPHPSESDKSSSPPA
ncbi:MAG: hypothetical protein ACPL2N_05495 [Candidatus Cryosericum sp.]